MDAYFLLLELEILAPSFLKSCFCFLPLDSWLLVLDAIFAAQIIL
jgi:hypothetical protein